MLTTVGAASGSIPCCSESRALRVCLTSSFNVSDLIHLLSHLGAIHHSSANPDQSSSAQNISLLELHYNPPPFHLHAHLGRLFPVLPRLWLSVAAFCPSTPGKLLDVVSARHGPWLLPQRCEWLHKPSTTSNVPREAPVPADVTGVKFPK